MINAEIKRIEDADAAAKIPESERRLFGKTAEEKADYAEEEIVARACEDRLASSSKMKTFAEEIGNKDSSLVQRFADFLGKAIEKLKKILEFCYQTEKFLNSKQKKKQILPPVAVQKN